MKLGIVATDVRGSVGGTTFSRNTSGAITRARVKPINPRTPAQTLVRSNFGTNSKAWSGSLTADQRAAWTFFAQANPQVNKLGDSIIISGLAMYNMLNQVLAQINQPPISDPPSDLSVPALAAPEGYEILVSIPTIAVETALQSVVAGASYYISATGPLSAGQKPPKNAYRFMGASAATAGGTTVDITAAWTATFGTALLGKSYGVSVRTVNTATGALTPEIILYGAT